jgi:hypothetical protein
MADSVPTTLSAFAMSPSVVQRQRIPLRIPHHVPIDVDRVSHRLRAGRGPPQLAAGKSGEKINSPLLFFAPV